MNQDMIPLILIAEDDPSMRHLLERSLSMSGARICSFEDAESAIDALENADKRFGSLPNLVITDVNMPGDESGLDVLHVARSLDASVPVVVITAFGDRRLHRRARELGASRVVDKPFDLQPFRQDVMTLLERRCGVAE